MKRTLASMVIATGVCGQAVAGDWAQFLGPERSAVSTETGLSKGWPKDGPKVLWSTPMGPGYGAAAIQGGEVVVLDRGDDEGKDILRVIDIKTGKDKWSYSYDAPGRASHPGSRSTPTVEGEFIYTVGSFGDVYCFSRKTQKPVWNLDLDKKFGEAQLKWAYAQSPLIYKDTLIVSPLGNSAPALVALDKKTGEVKWQSEQKFGGDYYCSPVLEKVAGVEGVLIALSNTKEKNLILFADPRTGKTIWTFDKFNCMWTIPAPTVLPDGKHVFITGGYDAGSVMITVEKSGDGFKTAEKWRITEGSQLHPAVFHKGFLYVNINTNATLKKGNEKTGGLACIDPGSGKVVWRSGEKPNYERGGFILADNKIIIVEGKIGDLCMVEPNARGLKEIARAPMFTPGKGNVEIWAPLALSNGLLVIRDHTVMKCLDLRGKATASR